jgi:hypothetical protein
MLSYVPKPDIEDADPGSGTWPHESEFRVNIVQVKKKSEIQFSGILKNNFNKALQQLFPQNPFNRISIYLKRIWIAI